MNRREEKMNIIKKLSVAFAVLLVVCIACRIVIYAIDKKNAENRQQLEVDEGVIEVDGKKYVPKKNIETYLFMGIDNYDEVKKAEDYGESGQCDVIILMVRDITTGTFKTLSINRNTLMEVNTIDLDGEYIGTSVVQLALAHAHGDGMELSCENVADAVSGFLGGQKIDGYAAVNMGGVAIINHMVGGVTVTIEDDFSNADATLEMGKTITLDDQQALTFIRGRMGVGDGSNVSRMKRQSAYMADLKVKLREKCNQDSTFPLDVYDGMEAYMVTNISKQKFSKIALLVAKEKDEGELSIEGTTGEDESGFTAFEADEDSLQDVILELFYKEYK
ncbi:MAG: LCP family protein [Clostridium sp.]|nr:LCP family protein [Clostridium sp.]MCM1399612.1 LCP family protein [Clostridium sp.]MCM1460166.1 LCP family protein [Bacteroides sp.]